jgi:hypothetical protein
MITSVRPKIITKKYKYIRWIFGYNQKDLWGETIRRAALLMVLTLAASLVIPALAEVQLKEEVLGEAIFEGIGEIKFPAGQDTNIDVLKVGNDRALAFGPNWGGVVFDPKATNNLEIKKNQDSGACASCCDQTSNCAVCEDACIKVNIEAIKVGDRTAMAFGFGTVATNNVKIVTNQQ